MAIRVLVTDRRRVEYGAGDSEEYVSVRFLISSLDDPPGPQFFMNCGFITMRADHYLAFVGNLLGKQIDTVEITEIE